MGYLFAQKQAIVLINTIYIKYFCIYIKYYIKLKLIPVFMNKLLYFMFVDNCFMLVGNDKTIDEFFNKLINADNFIDFKMDTLVITNLLFSYTN